MGKRKPLYCQPEYIVDSDGYIISKRNKTPMKPSSNTRGYQITMIRKDNKTIGMPIHSAVAKTFLGDYTKQGLQINHIDGDKTNNALSNLEWVTPKENTKHSINVLGNSNKRGKSPLAKKVLATNIITNELTTFDSLASAVDFIQATKKSVGKRKTIQTCILRVINNTRPTAYGYIWKYL